MEIKTLPSRKDVPIEETWNLENIFKTDKEWENAKDEILACISDLIDYKGKLSESPEVLADFMDLGEETFRKALKVMVYGSLSSSVDAMDQEAQARAGQGQSTIVRLNAAVSFLNPELMTIGFETLRKWIKDEQRLSHLGHFIDELEREKEHVRSDEVEQVLALAGEPLNNFFRTYNAMTNADLQFQEAINHEGETFEVGQSSIGSLITHQNRKVRQTSFENYANGYLTHKNTLAAIQQGGIHSDVFKARTRNYVSSIEASLGSNNIPPAVFHALIDTFKNNLTTWHRYWRVCKKALGFETFHEYDIKAPLSLDAPEIPFEQAIDWIYAGLSPLGDDYVNTMRNGALTERWIDRARNRGKRQGAFSSGVYDTNPYILMSYANDVFSLSTLAHELGHSMHSYYTNKNQPFIYSHYSLFVAEVASNFNQAMVRDYLFKNKTDPAFQLALIEEAMSNFHRYFFIMPTLARWELTIHERAEAGKPLTAEIMSEICADYFAEGYGEEVDYDRERTGITWAQFPHMYMNFYVYQYATGISAAHALSDGILHGGKDKVERYLGFLGTGGSEYPLEALKKAGVDMSSSEPVNKAFAVMADYVDRLEILVEKGKE